TNSSIGSPGRRPVTLRTISIERLEFDRHVPCRRRCEVQSGFPQFAKIITFPVPPRTDVWMSGAIGNPAEPPERLHGFDAVRGLAAVAVVALHAAYPYIVAPMPGLVWTVPVDDPSWLCDTVFWWIEGCVMPLFFTLSGYFLARSIARQSAREFLAGRTRRLLLPMATIGLAVLTLDLQVWAYGLISTG